MTASAVIFHCDGVLVDSQAIAHRIIADNISRLGWKLTEKDVTLRFGGQTEDFILAEVWKYLDDNNLREEEWDASAWWRQVERGMYTAFKKELKPVTGVEPVLSLLRKSNIPVCATTQFSIERAGVSLSFTGLSKHLSIKKIFAQDMVDKPKPHPDLHIYAARRMGVHPTNCIAIEDTASGAKAALAAGMKVLGYARNAKQASDLESAGAYIFHSMGRLPKMLQLAA